VRFFDRKLRLRVGPPGSPGRLIDEKYRVTFAVEMTNKQGSNSASIEVYGLNKESRDLISKEGNIIFLEAGYKDTSEQLFTGAITRTQITFAAPNIITTFEAADGVFLVQDIKINLAFAENTPVSAVLSAVAAQLGLPLVLGIPVLGVYRQGIALNNTAREALDILAKKAEFKWSIQNGQLQIAGEGIPIPGRAAVLSGSTGLIRTPEKIEDAAVKDRLGWKIASLLQPRITPNSLVVLNSVAATGTFVAERVWHRGDTFGQEWETQAEVFSVG